jgi:hypothetical protein
MSNEYGEGEKWQGKHGESPPITFWKLLISLSDMGSNLFHSSRKPMTNYGKPFIQ